MSKQTNSKKGQNRFIAKKAAPVKTPVKGPAAPEKLLGNITLKNFSSKLLKTKATEKPAPKKVAPVAAAAPKKRGRKSKKELEAAAAENEEENDDEDEAEEEVADDDDDTKVVENDESPENEDEEENDDDDDNVDNEDKESDEENNGNDAEDNNEDDNADEEPGSDQEAAEVEEEVVEVKPVKKQPKAVPKPAPKKILKAKPVPKKVTKVETDPVNEEQLKELGFDENDIDPVILNTILAYSKKKRNNFTGLTHTMIEKIILISSLIEHIEDKNNIEELRGLVTYTGIDNIQKVMALLCKKVILCYSLEKVHQATNENIGSEELTNLTTVVNFSTDDEARKGNQEETEKPARKNPFVKEKVVVLENKVQYAEPIQAPKQAPIKNNQVQRPATSQTLVRVASKTPVAPNPVKNTPPDNKPLEQNIARPSTGKQPMPRLQVETMKNNVPEKQPIKQLTPNSNAGSTPKHVAEFTKKMSAPHTVPTVATNKPVQAQKMIQNPAQLVAASKPEPVRQTNQQFIKDDSDNAPEQTDEQGSEEMPYENENQNAASGSNDDGQQQENGEEDQQQGNNEAEVTNDSSDDNSGSNENDQDTSDEIQQPEQQVQEAGKEDTDQTQWENKPEETADNASPVDNADQEKPTENSKEEQVNTDNESQQTGSSVQELNQRMMNDMKQGSAILNQLQLAESPNHKVGPQQQMQPTPQRQPSPQSLRPQQSMGNRLMGQFKRRS